MNHLPLIRILFLLLIAFAWQTTLQGQIERSKEFTKEFNGKNAVSVSHRHGPLTVKKSSDGKVKFVAILSVKAKNEEAIEALFGHFNIETKESGNRVDLVTQFQTKNWNTINGKTTITFKDGSKVTGLKDMKVEFVLYTPVLQNLKLENKYDKILIEDDFTGNLHVELYSGELETQNIGGDFNFSMKYSKAQLGQVSGKTTLDLYDGKLQLKNAGATSLKSKYSEIKLGNLESLNANTYDDDLEIGNINGDLQIDDKYSEFKLGNFKNATISMHDGEVEGAEGSNVKLNSKYSEFKFQKLIDLDVESSHDDNFKIQTLHSLNAQSKYSEFDIGQLNHHLAIPDSHDDEINIEQLSADFKTILLNGKYTDLEVAMPQGTKYHLYVNMTYGKVNYPTNQFEKQIHIERGSTVEIKGNITGATEKSGKISVEGHNNKVDLN